MKYIKKINEEYGLFDKIKSSNSKSKLNNVLRQHGYPSEGDFLKDIDRINAYADILYFDPIPKDISIQNIQRVYAIKQDYEEIIEVVDELDMLLREIKDEGIQVEYRYNTKYRGEPSTYDHRYAGYQGSQGYYSVVEQNIRNFGIHIKPKEMNSETLYIIFGVLMEAEGRGEISFKDISVDSEYVYGCVFIDDEDHAKKLRNDTSHQPGNDHYQRRAG